MAKKIINGWRFDTETATALGEATNFGAGASSILDFNYWSEVLYVTKKNRALFFSVRRPSPEPVRAALRGRHGIWERH